MARSTLLLLLFFFARTVFSQQNITETIFHNSLERSYTLRLPPNYEANTPLPAVLVLHGGGGNSGTVQNFTQMNPVADTASFIAVYPQGFAASGNGYAWADGRGTVADEEGIDDVGFVELLLDVLTANYAIDQERIYVCGFSNGGFMTQRLACEIGGRFAAAGSLGCSMGEGLFSSCAPEHPLPMIFVAGTEDPFVPYEGGFMNANVELIVPVDTAVQYWARQNDCEQAPVLTQLPDLVPDDNSTVEQLDYPGCACGESVRLLRLIGAGHTWAGVENPLIEPLLGETNEDIHASVELWRFFEPFQRGCSTTSTAAPAAGHSGLRVFPNPFQNQLTLELEAPLREAAKLSLYHGSGQMLHAEWLAAGLRQYSVAIPGSWSDGWYLIEVTTAQQVQQQVLFKTR